MKNTVYIATSLDGYIAGKNNELDWLQDIPNPTASDLGFAEFIARIDALVMGRNTFDVVAGFGGEWPYTKPVFVLSNTLNEIPSDYDGKVFLVKGELNKVLAELHGKGFHDLYIDGGKTVQSFLAADLIDEMIITTIPIILGGGIPLFGSLVQPLKFKHTHSLPQLDYIVTNTYTRNRS